MFVPPPADGAVAAAGDDQVAEVRHGEAPHRALVRVQLQQLLELVRVPVLHRLVLACRQKVRKFLS